MKNFLITSGLFSSVLFTHFVSANTLTLDCTNKDQFITSVYVDYDKQQIVLGNEASSPFVCNTSITTKEEKLHCTTTLVDNEYATTSATLTQIANDTFYLDMFLSWHPKVPEDIENTEDTMFRPFEVTMREVCFATDKHKL